MDDNVILTELEAQARSMPAFMSVAAFRRPDAITPDDYKWIGRTIALLTLWDSIKAISARVAAQNLDPSPLFQGNVGTIQLGLHEAIADLNLRVGQKPGGVYGINEVHDFYQDFKDVIGLAVSDLLIVDPYLSDDIFTYLPGAASGVTVRLMMKPKQQLTAQLQSGRKRFEQQYHRQVEVRQTDSIHDRVVLLNRQTCYVLGASIRDAAKTAPTSLSPFPADLTPDKLAAYEAIWVSATAI